MSKLALCTPEGRLLSDEATTAQPPAFDLPATTAIVMEDLYREAAREAEKCSTKREERKD